MVKLWNSIKRKFFHDLNNSNGPSIIKKSKFNPAYEDLLEIKALVKKLPKLQIPESEIEILKINRIDITQFDTSSDIIDEYNIDNSSQSSESKNNIPMNKKNMDEEYKRRMERNRNDPTKRAMAIMRFFSANNIHIEVGQAIPQNPIIPNLPGPSKSPEKQPDNKQPDNKEPDNKQPDNKPNNVKFDIIIQDNDNNEIDSDVEEVEGDDDDEDDSPMDTIVKYPQTFLENYNERIDALNHWSAVKPTKFGELTRYAIEVKTLEMESDRKREEFEQKKKEYMINLEKMNKIEREKQNKIQFEADYPNNSDDDDIIDDDNQENKNDNNKNNICQMINKLIDKRKTNKNYKQIFGNINGTDDIEMNDEKQAELNKPQVIGPNGTKVSGKVLNMIDWTKPGHATRKLLMELFDRNTLASQTLSGKKSPIYIGDINRPTKNQLDPIKISDIIYRIRLQCNVTEREIRIAITTKCSDENKMYQYRQKKMKSIQAAKSGDNKEDTKEKKIITLEIKELVDIANYHKMLK